MDTTKFLRVSKKRTLATNRTVENNKKPREESLDENPEVDSVFSTSMNSPECLQILFNSLLNVEKIREMQDKTRSSQIKGELQLKDLSEAV